MQCMCKSSAASPQNGGQQQNGQNGNSGSQDGFARPGCVTKDFIACNTNAAQCEWSTDTYTITLNQAQNFVAVVASCAETAAISVAVDFAACTAVSTLTDATACNAVNTAADAAVSACTYTAAVAFNAGAVVTQTIGDKTITGTLKAAIVGGIDVVSIAITAKPGNTFFFKSSPIKINGITVAGSTGSNAIKSIESNGDCKSKCIAGKVFMTNKCKDCAIGRIRKEDTSSNECIICENGQYQDQVSCF